MHMPQRGHTRAERLRQHAAAIEEARRTVGAMGLLVRGREARACEGEPPLEVQFAQAGVDGGPLPAAVWVALRRDDVDAAIDAMTAASQTHFLIEEREEIGEGYRLTSVQDTAPLPESQRLTAQLSQMLDVPIDVLTVIAEWGPDDPRISSEIVALLTSRFGPVAGAEAETIESQPPAVEEARRVERSGRLTMTVTDAAQVLRLDDDQTRALAVLVRNAAVTLTA
jgi:hypothetical protein